jgi:hypothetical protein
VENKQYGLHSVSSDSVVLGTHHKPKFLELKHNLHSFVYKNGKSIIEDYFPCNRKENKCKLNHIKQWIRLFIDQHNQEIMP